MYPCKCCNHPTLPCPSADAVAFICPICFWENDVFIANDQEPSDENRGLTLSEGRQNFRQYGICDPRLKEPCEIAASDADSIHADDPIIGGSHRTKAVLLPKSKEDKISSP